MNTLEFKKIYLSNYLLLEKDFLSTSEFVSIAEANYSTYSVVYLKLLLSIGSEIEILLKFLADLYDQEHKEKGFGCSKIILKHEPDMLSLEIELTNENITIHPWNYETIPKWWTAYNEIKHNRYESAEKFNPARKYYQYANLNHVLNALGALFSLELYAYRLIAIEEQKDLFIPTINSIFSIKNSYWKDIIMSNGYVLIGTTLHMHE